MWLTFDNQVVKIFHLFLHLFLHLYVCERMQSSMRLYTFAEIVLREPRAVGDFFLWMGWKHTHTHTRTYTRTHTQTYTQTQQ